jgi:hypothetical protein
MQKMIVSSRKHMSEQAVVVTTPLDAIMQLEGPGRIGTVVLAGSFAMNEELANSLAELYPGLRIECEA